MLFLLLSSAVVAIAVVGFCCCSSVATACLITLFGSCSGYAGKIVIVKIIVYHMEYFCNLIDNIQRFK